LNDAYYNFIHESKIENDSLTVAPPESLIPLKARAWLDLTGRQDTDEKDIKKHKNDVFRLFQVIAPDTRVVLPGSIKDDLQRFIQAVEADPPKSLKPFGLGATKADEVIKTLRSIYELST
jgi:hypothetical protein